MSLFRTILTRFIVPEAGGPGGACGLCYELTPVSNTSQLLDKQAMTFMIVDECPASANPSQKDAGRSTHCGQCQLGDVNDFGQPFHFDVAVDAMNKDQYNLFFSDATGGRYASFLRNNRKSKTDVFLAEIGTLSFSKQSPAAQSQTPSHLLILGVVSPAVRTMKL